MTSTAGHVFISHGSENRDEAVSISAFLEERGIRTWIAPRDVRPGMDYSEQLQGAIEQCLAFVVLVSDMANKSPYVRAETEMAFSNNKPIFPVRQSDVTPGAGLAFFLKIRHWTDAYGKDADASMDRLARELRVLSGLADEAAVTPAGPVPTAPAAPASPPPPPAPDPQSSPEAVSPQPEEPPRPDEDRLRAAIGPKADYYLRRWRQMEAKNSPISWNWAACLANFFWFAYRKMWIWLGAMALAIVLLSAAGTVSPVLGNVALIVSILLTFVTGALGNHLYRRQIAALAANPALDEAALRKRGGVSKPALFATIGAVLVLVALAIAIAAQQMGLRPASPAGPAANALDPATNALDPATNAVDGDKPAEAAAPSGGAEAAGIDPSSLVGRWADVGDCANAVEFTADGRFSAPGGGGGGTWTLQGDRLTLSGPGGTETVQLTSLDQSAMYAVDSNGSVATSQRC